MILIKTNRDTLLKPLQIVTGIVERRHTLPILSNVLIKQDKDKVSFLATDLEIQIETSTKDFQPSDQTYSITVSAKKFQDILRAFPADLEVTLLLQDSRLQIKIGKSSFNLQVLPAEDFPKIAEETAPETKITIQQKELKTLLHHVQFAIAQQDIRYYLNGLLLLIEKTSLKAVATDGHRLSYMAINLDKSKDKKEIILPRKTVLELSKQLNDNEDPVTIEFFQNKIRFTFADIVMISKVIDGKFPDYNRVIPTENFRKFDLDRLTFLQALQRVSILSNLNEKFRGVRFVITNGILRILCKNNEQEEAQEELEIQYNDEEIDISFNITYLLDLLNNLNCKTIQCAFKDANNSVLITTLENEEFKYIVMPMRI
ncbi:MAG: DNA polymerase III subunit beta [Nitrosomonas sp.]|nr:DNA polymerase III subunit beta [Nitrosomonas sp.]MDP1951720.1 DNA polymerase III subunit beta [Nitrosomonas sp.]